MKAYYDNKTAYISASIKQKRKKEELNSLELSYLQLTHYISMTERQISNYNYNLNITIKA